MDPARLISVYAQTDVGRRRSSNEDRFAVDDRASDTGEALEEIKRFSDIMPILCVVSDGMGGALAGEVASQMTVDILREGRSEIEHGTAAQQSFFNTILADANEQIYQDAAENPHHRGMGATATAAIVHDRRVVIGQVGDSRAYLLREGELYQLTNDQTAVEFYVQSGMITPDEAAQHPQGNILLQALGTEAVIHPEISSLSLYQHDLLLLCSDGLTGLVDDARILALLLAHHELDEAGAALVEEANTQGGFDNITVVLLRCDGDAFPPVPSSIPELEMLQTFDLTPFGEEPAVQLEDPTTPVPEPIKEDVRRTSLRYGIAAAMLALILYATWRLMQ